MLGLCSAGLLNPRFIYTLLFALPSAAEMTPGDWHHCLQPVGQHERNAFPYQSENFPEQTGGQSARSVALGKKGKEGQAERTQTPVEGAVTKQELQSPVPVLQRKSALKPFGWQDVGCLSEQGQ